MALLVITNDTYQLIAWSVFGLIVGAGIAAMLSKGNALVRGVALSAIGAILVLTLRTNWSLRANIDALTERFGRVDWTSDCLSGPHHFDVRAFDAVANHFYDDCKLKCKQATRGEIELTPEEVKETWVLILQNASKTFYATNTIAPPDWPALACEKQRDAHAQAAVSIKRVMLLRQDEPNFNATLTALGRRQLRECGVEAIYTYQKNDLYLNFGTQITALGQIDVVFVDSQVVLITSYDERDKTIRKGVLTTDPVKVAAAQSLFAGLFRAARPLS